MKIRIKKINLFLRAKKIKLISLSVLLVSVGLFVFCGRYVFARDYAAEIAAKDQDIAQYQAEATRLAGQADTLLVALAMLTNERSQLQAQIDVSQAKYNQLLVQIANTGKQITDNKDALGITIANLYVEDDITPFEILFGSKNISDYIDKQEYRNSVRDQLTSTITKIKELKTQLDKQKIDAESILNDQKNQRALLVQKEAQQQALIDKTKGQEQAYQSLAQKTTEERNQIRLEQIAENASIGGNVVAGDPNKGGYPSYLANDPNWDGYTPIVDPWGLYSRQCVSYVAWKVHQSYIKGNSSHDMPYWGGIGHAWQWAYSGWAASWGDDAEYGAQLYYNNGNWHTANYETYGIPSGTEPKVGSVGVKNGKYGHVVWVEAVNGNNILVSQYNYNLDGQYSEMTVDKSKFSRYIYFNEW
jgi:peptidoglycan hydrolase CwlO-like protein